MLNRMLRTMVRSYPFRKGRGRIVDFARRHATGTTMCRDVFGNQLLVDLDNLIDNILYLEGEYERESIEFVLDWSGKNHCNRFVDVGANIGCFSLGVASDPKMQTIYAFEPDPHNRAQLLANLWLNNRVAQIRVFDQALSSAPGTAKLMMASRNRRQKGQPPGNSMLSSLEIRDDLSESVEVPLCRFDDLCNITGEPIAIKVDVEGHEFPVLSGMTRTLRENNCLLIVEIWHNNTEGFARIEGLLSPLGYHRHTDVNLGDNRVFMRNGSAPPQ